MNEDIKTSIIFLAGTLLWIELTDYLVFEYLVNGKSFAYYSHIKGVIYSFMATGFVYYTVKKRTTKLTELTVVLEHELKEKALLNREVHHRVKNNLALVTAMIELQMMQVKDDKLITELERIKLRIYAIAQIEEQIYQTESLSGVQINEFLDEYLDHISLALNQSSQFSNKCSENVRMNLNQAIPLGIIINELVNLISDTHSGEELSEIRVISEKVSDTLQLHFYCLIDTSLEEVFSSDSIQALIIRLYVEQLDIEMELDYNTNGEQMICFRVPLMYDKKGAHSSV